jgi:predicted nuclease of restriction endonuclease-like (RecB) superfamily
MIDFLFMVGGAVFVMCISGIINHKKTMWHSLTDEEILKHEDIVPNSYSLDLIEFARAIEAKLKEKNT